MKLFGLLIFGILILTGAIARAQSPELAADEPIRFEADEGLLTAEGNAVYTDGETRVEADLIRYFQETNRLEAEGNVRVTRKGLRLLSQNIVYNIQERTFFSGPFRAGYPPLFIEGDSFQGNLDQIDLNKVSIYFREPVRHSPRLLAETVQWVNEESLDADSIRLQLPFGWGLPLPGISYSFGSAVINGDATLGYESNLGAFVRSSFLYPIRSDASVGALLDAYSNRGILVGPALDLRLPNVPGENRVQLRSGWIQDQNEERRAEDIFDQPIDADRYFLDLSAVIISPTGDHQFQGQLTLRSDSEVLRDFRNDRFIQEYQSEPFADYTFQSGNLLVNLFARPDANDDNELVQRTPELRLAWLPTEIARTGWIAESFASFSRYRRIQSDDLRFPIAFPLNPFSYDSGEAGTNPSSLGRVYGPTVHRLDTGVGLTRPMAFVKGFQWVPRISARWLTWNPQVPDAVSSSTLFSEVGVDLEYRLNGRFAVDLQRLDIEEILHTVRFFVSQRYRSSSDSADSPPVIYDTVPYRPSKPQLNLLDARFPDVLSDRHLLRVGFENRFFARSSGQDARRIFHFDLYQDFLMDGPEGARTNDALYIESGFSPIPAIRFELEQKFNGEEYSSESTFFRTTFLSADLWQTSLTLEILDQAIDQLTFDAAYRVAENFSLFGQWQLDRRTDEWTEQRYGLARRFAHSWELDFYISFNEGNQRDSDVSVGLRLRWLEF